jgi:hypothetical protein
VNKKCLKYFLDFRTKADFHGSKHRTIDAKNSFNFFHALVVNMFSKSSFLSEKHPKHVKIHGEVSRISFFFALILMVFTNLTNGFFWLLPAVKDTYRLVIGVERNYDLPFKAV